MVEDWGLALVLGLYPLVGLTLRPGDALTLLGVATLVAVGARLPQSSPVHRPLLASGICVLLVLLCLLSPSPPAALSPVRGLVRLLLAGVLACALLRRAGSSGAPLRGVDPAFALAAAGAAGALVWLVNRGETELARILGGLAVSLALVFGVYRLHLRSPSTNLPLLARVGVLAAFGAVLVTFTRGGFA
jgi:hypothetical protein